MFSTAAVSGEPSYLLLYRTTPLRQDVREEVFMFLSVCVLVCMCADMHVLVAVCECMCGNDAHRCVRWRDQAQVSYEMSVASQRPLDEPQSGTH